MNFIKRMRYYIERKKIVKSRNVAFLLQQFYFLKNQDKGKDYNDVVRLANEEVDLIGFTKLRYDGKVVKIRCIRPGILIGRRGKDIDDLREFLNKELGFEVKVDIEEEKIISYMFGYGDYYMEGCF